MAFGEKRRGIEGLPSVPFRPALSGNDFLEAMTVLVQRLNEINRKLDVIIEKLDEISKKLESRS